MSQRKVVKIEEETDDVIVQFSGLTSGTQDDLKNKLSSCQFYNLESGEPVIQVGNQFFKGSLEPIHGTTVCFESQIEEPKEPGSAAQKKLSYYTQTDKLLTMKRVFLQAKTNDDPQESSANTER